MRLPDSYYDEPEYPTLMFNRTRKARKQHKCRDCNEPIEARERYVETVYLFDGHWYRYRTHLYPCISEDYDAEDET